MEDSQQKATILAVDDSKVMLVAAAKALREEFEVLRAADGQQAWEMIQQHPEISVVFSDLSMPNMDGYGLLAAIRSSDDPHTAKLPVVILTGQEDGDGTKEKVMQAGATDYLIKPFEALDLLSRARSLSSLSTQVSELEKKVSLDKLTRLYTEASFNESGERAVAYAVRHGTPIGVLRFDIDKFSDVFVKHGKQVAESVLSKISVIIKSVLRQEDIAARVGVAKFALLLIETDQEGIGHVINRLRKALDEADLGCPEKITLSVGCSSPLVDDSLKFKLLKEHAEKALEEAIGKGSNQTVYAEVSHQPEQETKTEKRGPRIDLSAVMREIERNQGERLGGKQLNAALNSVIPLLTFLNKKMSLELEDVIKKLTDKVEK